jgi:hypothetical protein
MVEELLNRWRQLSTFIDLAEDHKEARTRAELEHPGVTAATPTMITLIDWADNHARQLDLIRTTRDAVNTRPELLRRRLQDGQVERVALQRLEGRSLAPAPVGQELARLQSVSVTAGLV